MTEIKTLPDVWYTVTTENGCTIYRADGTRMLKEIEPGQGFFRAVENKVFCSDPDAIFRPFENAPRLKLALLQGVAGGWLPTGFTELDYLETSGTQYIKVLDIFGTNNDLVMGRFLIPETSLTATQVLFGSRNAWRNSAICVSVSVTTPGFAQFANQTKEFDCNPFLDEDLQLIISRAGCELNGTLVAEFAQATFTAASPYYLFTTTDTGVVDNRMLIGRCYSFSIIRNGVTILDFVPVLNKDGEPGMWDKVNKRFFGNAGTGTFGYALKGQGERSTYSLRNPGVVPPSGIYARKSGENALEILADTEETTGEGWEWFANTAEAYEHLGVVPNAEENF